MANGPKNITLIRTPMVQQQYLKWEAIMNMFSKMVLQLQVLPHSIQTMQQCMCKLIMKIW